ncbi:hypothetical protein RQP46_001762 [Phenoliferia psychrophenolica]
MAFRFIASQPALMPLFLAVGLGMAGSAAFAGHYLSNNQDVVIRKSASRDPWNNVTQGTNTKLFSYRPEEWAARQNLPDPRAMFKEASGTSDEAKIAKAKAIRKASLGKEQSAH